MSPLESVYFPQVPTVIAVSGWVDSMVLLDLAMRTLPHDCLTVAHFDHSLRWTESDDDRLFVENFATKNGLGISVEKKDVAEYARDRQLGIEEAARNCRYGFLERVMRETGALILMTAHHLDDRIETMLFNLIRGTKFSGIYSLREEDSRDFGKIRRPLIHVKKSDILAYAHERNIAYREDSTNTETDFQRNFLRHAVLPKFAEINAEYQSAIGGFIRYVEEFSEWQALETAWWIESQSERYFTQKTRYDAQYVFSREDFAGLHRIRQGLVVEYLYRTMNRGNVGFSEWLLEELLRFIAGDAPFGIKDIRDLHIERRGEWIVIKTPLFV